MILDEGRKLNPGPWREHSGMGVSATGYCLIEKRILDVTLRHGVNEYTIEKWKATFEIQKYFEERIGKSIYSVLPNVVENTFNF